MTQTNWIQSDSLVVKNVLENPNVSKFARSYLTYFPYMRKNLIFIFPQIFFIKILDLWSILWREQWGFIMCLWRWDLGPVVRVTKEGLSSLECCRPLEQFYLLRQLFLNPKIPHNFISKISRISIRRNSRGYSEATCVG